MLLPPALRAFPLEDAAPAAKGKFDFRFRSIEDSIKYWSV